MAIHPELQERCNVILDEWYNKLPLTTQLAVAVIMDAGRFDLVLNRFGKDPSFPLQALVALIKEYEHAT